MLSSIWVSLLLSIVGCGYERPSPYVKPLELAAAEVDIGDVDLASFDKPIAFNVLRVKRGDIVRFRGRIRESGSEGKLPVYIDLLRNDARQQRGIVNQGGTIDLNKEDGSWSFIADVRIPDRSVANLQLIVRAGSISIARGEAEIYD